MPLNFSMGFGYSPYHGIGPYGPQQPGPQQPAFGMHLSIGSSGIQGGIQVGSYYRSFADCRNAHLLRGLYATGQGQAESGRWGHHEQNHGVWPPVHRDPPPGYAPPPYSAPAHPAAFRPAGHHSGEANLHPLVREQIEWARQHAQQRMNEQQMEDGLMLIAMARSITEYDRDSAQANKSMTEQIRRGRAREAGYYSGSSTTTSPRSHSPAADS